ncbi:uncharacterized protein EI90DRAFT_3056627, partial [Cantharellus anzutake]|uniref:uncharacterized protein n=1 Tax=Cantharellus anzutake TaxID=1750568 RepID=UPI0019045779
TSFLSVFGSAWLDSITEAHIMTSFHVTGVYPFDPTVIHPCQLAPSIEHSTHADLPLPVTSPVKRMIDNTPSPLDDSQNPRMYLDGQNGGSDENDNDDGDDQPIINPLMCVTHRQQSDLQSSCCLGSPMAHSQAKKRVLDDLECIMSLSSSSNFIVSTEPLSSTFKLPERVYGDGRSLRNIQWGLAEDTNEGRALTDTEYEKKTREELIAELDYVTSALLSREEGEKNKEEGGRIKGVFGHVVTHEGFIQQQSDRAKKREMEDAVEKAKKEVQKGWEEFQRHQKAGEAAWKVQKEQLQALKQKVPKKPKAVTKKDWMAENYPQLVISPSDTVKECGKGVEEPICDADEQ